MMRSHPDAKRNSVWRCDRFAFAENFCCIRNGSFFWKIGREVQTSSNFTFWRVLQYGIKESVPQSSGVAS